MEVRLTVERRKMNLRKLFLVAAFLSVSFFMAACTSEPSDELVEQVLKAYDDDTA